MEADDSVTPRNSALLTDLYQLTMCAAYFKQGHRGRATFDLFVRSMPPNRSYLLFAGLESALFYLRNLRFTPECIEYLASTKVFDEPFLRYLERFRFEGDLYAMPEGTVFFPQEPVMRLTAPLLQAQFVETYLLNNVNFQTLVASKAARVVGAAHGRGLVDFSPRRAHGSDAAMKVARSSYMAGFEGTSNVLAGMKYGLSTHGTVAHSFIMSYESELDSFRAYARAFPEKCLLLIDTYDTAEGARNAAKVGLELQKTGRSLVGVRLDSGDLLRLSRKVRRILDGKGLAEAKIFASGNLDEYKIDALVRKGAPIDAFGVGTSIGTSNDAPSLNVNYKLSEMERGGGSMRPVLKLSTGKRTFPGRKQVYRQFTRKGLMNGDVLGLDKEDVGGEPLLKRVMRGGKPAAGLPSLEEIRENARRSLDSLPGKYKRLRGAPAYPVRTSRGLSLLLRSMKKQH